MLMKNVDQGAGMQVLQAQMVLKDLGTVREQGGGGQGRGCLDMSTTPDCLMSP